MQSTGPITPEFIEGLMMHTQALFNHVFWVKHDFKLTPKREHIGSSISFTDINPRKDDFLREILNTITGWVYSKAKAKGIVDRRLSEVSNDIINASSFLTTQAFSKFRRGNPQGQFGELLLFNFLQHFYRATPLLRKMRITTSTGHERFGSDAVHFKKHNEQSIFILGESKCYESKYQFKTAFKASLTSIINTFNSFNKELDLYTYDDFIEPELEVVAQHYKSGILKNVHFELVCLIAYNETNKIKGSNESEIKASIQSIIQERCESLESSIFNVPNSLILDRINYIIMPIWQLDEFLSDFARLIGV